MTGTDTVAKLRAGEQTLNMYFSIQGDGHAVFKEFRVTDGTGQNHLRLLNFLHQQILLRVKGELNDMSFFARVRCT